MKLPDKDDLIMWSDSDINNLINQLKAELKRRKSIRKKKSKEPA